MGRTLGRAEVGTRELTAEASWEPKDSIGVAIGAPAEVASETMLDTIDAIVLIGGSPFDRIGLAIDPISLAAELIALRGALAALVTTLSTLETADAASPAPELMTLKTGSRGEPLLEPAAEVAEASTDDATLCAAETADETMDATGLPDSAEAAAEAAAEVAFEMIDSTAEAGMSEAPGIADGMSS